MSTRRLKRRHLIFYLPVIREDTGEKLGNVADITVAGLMLVGEKAIETGQEFKVRIDLPRPVRGQTTLRLAARSLWSSPDANPSLHDTGFQITQLATADAITLRCLVDRFAFDD